MGCNLMDFSNLVPGSFGGCPAGPPPKGSHQLVSGSFGGMPCRAPPKGSHQRELPLGSRLSPKRLAPNLFPLRAAATRGQSNREAQSAAQGNCSGPRGLPGALKAAVVSNSAARLFFDRKGSCGWPVLSRSAGNPCSDEGVTTSPNLCTRGWAPKTGPHPVQASETSSATPSRRGRPNTERTHQAERVFLAFFLNLGGWTLTRGSSSFLFSRCSIISL